MGHVRRTLKYDNVPSKGLPRRRISMPGIGMYNIVECLLYEYHWQKKTKEEIPRRVMTVVVVEG